MSTAVWSRPALPFLLRNKSTRSAFLRPRAQVSWGLIDQFLGRPLACVHTLPQPEFESRKGLRRLLIILLVSEDVKHIHANRAVIDIVTKQPTVLLLISWCALRDRLAIDISSCGEEIGAARALQATKTAFNLER